jgi:ABC-type amino acid transport substrate-binding protein
MNYTPLAKLPGTVSFALVTGPKTLIFDPSELNGQRIATLPAPGLGALRLNAMFPNPARQPMLVTVNNSEEAVEDLLAGKVKAAMIPAPLVGNYPNLNTVLTTQPVPHMALSASPKVPKAVQDKIRSALLNATKTPAGQKMLQAVHIEGFQPVSANTYAPYAKLLQDTWGY